MQTFEERINELRWDVIQSIIEILRENKLLRLELSAELENPAFVIWHNPQEDVFYSTPVVSVFIEGDDICAEVLDDDSLCRDTISTADGSLSNIDWLIGIRNDVIETIRLGQNGN